jgi:hypothetical protein
MDFKIFLLLQLERIQRKPTVHAPGPRKPTLSQQDNENKK